MSLPCSGHPTLPPRAWEVASNGDRAHRTLNAAAARVCGDCPVRDTCLQAGLDNPYNGGLIMGGEAIITNTRGRPYSIGIQHCAWCNTQFFPHNRVKKFCGDRCANYATQARAQLAAVA
jgi:hypothetical protein